LDRIGGMGGHSPLARARDFVAALEAMDFMVAGIAAKGGRTMKSRQKVSRATCVHESGHGIALCAYESGFHSICVRARAEIDGCYGIVEPVCRAFCDLDGGVRFLISTVAGPLAELKQAYHSDFGWYFSSLAEVGRNEEVARKLKLPITEVLDDPLPDCDEIDYLRALYFLAPEDKENRERIHSAVGGEVIRFLRDKQMWAAINRLADLLQARKDLYYGDADVRAIADGITRIDGLLARMGMAEMEELDETAFANPDDDRNARFRPVDSERGLLHRLQSPRWRVPLSMGRKRSSLVL
jgi:hypothetical protein